MKQRIRLTESDLHRIVKESVNNVLNEELSNPNQHYENIRYLTQIIRRLNYLCYEELSPMICSLVGKNHDIRNIMEEIFDNLNNACKVLDINNDENYYRYDKTQSPSDFLGNN